MIIIARDLILSEPETLTANNPIILWRSLLSTTNVDSTTADPDFPVSNLANPATHLIWKAGVNTGDEYITITTGTLEEIDGLGIARHNFGSANIVVSVEATSSLGDSPETWTEIVQEVQLADDAPVLFRFEPAAYEAVRLKMQPGDEAPQAGVMYLHKLLILERSIKIDVPHTPFPLGIVSKEVNGKSESGQFLGRIEVNRFNESEADFSHFTPTFYRTYFQPFVSARPSFFFAWNPTEYPLECGYAWLMSNPKPEVDTVTRRVAIKLTMQGVV